MVCFPQRSSVSGMGGRFFIIPSNHNRSLDSTHTPHSALQKTFSLWQEEADEQVMCCEQKSLHPQRFLLGPGYCVYFQEDTWLSTNMSDKLKLSSWKLVVKKTHT